MSSSAPPIRPSFRFSHRHAVAMVVLGTLFGVVAQALFKTAVNRAGDAGLLQVIQHPALIGGLACYGMFTVLLTLALRDGELSLLYPVISLTYVWVTLLSVFYFNEQLTVSKGVGVAIICGGVALLGRSNGKK